MLVMWLNFTVLTAQFAELHWLAVEEVAAKYLPLIKIELFEWCLSKVQGHQNSEKKNPWKHCTVKTRRQNPENGMYATLQVSPETYILKLNTNTLEFPKMTLKSMTPHQVNANNTFKLKRKSKSHSIYWQL